MRRFKHFIAEQTVHDHVDHFVNHACDYLGIQNPPQISLVDDKEEASNNASFGGYSPNTQGIRINIAGRHTADVLRTLAHELVHHKQNEDGRLTHDAGETGSEFENEANAKAGIIMRNYGKTNRKIYENHARKTVNK